MPCQKISAQNNGRFCYTEWASTTAKSGTKFHGFTLICVGVC